MIAIAQIYREFIGRDSAAIQLDQRVAAAALRYGQTEGAIAQV